MFYNEDVNNVLRETRVILFESGCSLLSNSVRLYESEHVW